MPCKNLKNHLTCFLCSKRCHVECATEKNIKLCEYKKVICNIYCYDCENSVFPFQSVNNLDQWSAGYFKSVNPKSQN